MTRIATLVRRKSYIAIDEKKYNIAFASKGLIDKVLTCNDNRKSPPNRSYSGSDDTPHRKSSKGSPRFRHSQRRNSDVKRN